ncbi:CRE-TTR-30 protein [Caenorhabditis remanei]|uniref:CRE-TTR-30 protein n=2 Tax=Caenorhabditis remanei TaxID=31234 RepID=E3LCY1_CAERE|nr:CRE-TTR-30 protein [Caenorhabditis remanei]
MPSAHSTILLISFLIVSCYSITIELGNLQSVAVNGTLLCNDKPANNIKVKLYEEEAILDVLLDERFTSEDGTFEMAGSKSEVTTIDPKLNIYHKCNYDGICVRKISILIPPEYITNGEKPARTYNIGMINLASKFSGQSTDCFN